MIYWIIFLILDGICDGFLYNIRNYDKSNPVNEHCALWLRRALVAVVIFQFDYYAYISALLVSFVAHDTPYYLTRHLLDKRNYPNWYWVTSTTSTACSDKFMNTTMRAIFFVSGLFIYNQTYSIAACIIMLVAFGIGLRNLK